MQYKDIYDTKTFLWNPEVRYFKYRGGSKLAVAAETYDQASSKSAKHYFKIIERWPRDFSHSLEYEKIAPIFV